MKIGVYVGSFNPVHYGHIKVINYLLNNNYVDKVLVLPTPGYWDKQNLASIEDRVNMLKFYEDNKIIVDDVHNNYPYTYQVLDAIKKDYKDDELFLIIGADNLKDLDKWKNIDKILENKIIVLQRYFVIIDTYIDKFDRSKFIVIEDYPFVDISSTEIRQNLDSTYLNPKVLKYIKDNNLYK